MAPEASRIHDVGGEAVHVAFRRDTVDRYWHLLSALAGERRIHISIGVHHRAGDGVHVFRQQTTDLQGDSIAGCAVLTHLQVTDFGGLRHPNAHARGAAHQDRSQRAVEYGEGTASRHRTQRAPAEFDFTAWQDCLRGNGVNARRVRIGVV